MGCVPERWLQTASLCLHWYFDILLLIAVLHALEEELEEMEASEIVNTLTRLPGLNMEAILSRAHILDQESAVR